MAVEIKLSGRISPHLTRRNLWNRYYHLQGMASQKTFHGSLREDGSPRVDQTQVNWMALRVVATHLASQLSWEDISDQSKSCPWHKPSVDRLWTLGGPIPRREECGCVLVDGVKG